MNLKNKRRIGILMCTLLLTAMCIAGEVLLSPALPSLEKQIKLEKCGVVNQETTFSAADFDEVFRNDTEFLRIDSLPDAACGALTLGSLPLSENQLVAREDFERIVFTPTPNTASTAVFHVSDVTDGNAMAAVCNVYVLEDLNLAPVTGETRFTTADSVAVCKFLNVADPEGDGMHFEVVSYPAHGAVYISENADGYFRYVPQKGYVGKDSFEYVAYDCYGNKSDIATVSVSVTPAVSKVRYDDMTEHWAHNAALTVSSFGLMEGTTDEKTGAYCFYPEASVSRGDFLAMALIAAGKESAIDFVSETSFADDADIPMNIKSYAEYALANGIVSGYTDTVSQATFAGTKPITRAEAAVIVDRILTLPDTATDLTGFSDFADIPSWAQAPMANLSAYGIMNGTGFGELKPIASVSRGETAEILCNIHDYVTETYAAVQEKEKSRNLLNLFGLL